MTKITSPKTEEKTMTKTILCRVMLVAALALVVLPNSRAQAQSDTETFTVTANAVLTVAAPIATVGITHDGTDTNQAFAAQSWAVSQNGAAGATISFSTNQAFTNTVNTAYKRNAKLDLAIASSEAAAGWTVSVATDTTDYANVAPDGVATVTAASTAPGDATFNLTATFITTDFSTMASGAYAMTVTGTITAN